MFKIRVTHKPAAILHLTILLFFGLAVEPGSEDFVLTTTYPAPYASYANITAAQIVLTPQQTPPSPGPPGSLYYDQGLKTLLQSNGAQWISLAGGEASHWSLYGANAANANAGSVVIGDTVSKASMTVYGPLLVIGDLIVDGQVQKK